MPRWSLGLWVSRAYYDDARRGGRRRARSCASDKIPCDVLTLDGRTAWNAETRFDFEWDAERFPDPAGDRWRRSSAHEPARLRLGISVRVGQLAAVPASSRTAAFLLRDRERRALCVRVGRGAGCASPFGDALTPLPDSGIVDFTNPAALRVVARRAPRALRRRRQRDQERLRRARARRRRRASTATGGGRLHNVYPLLYNQLRIRGDARVPSRGRRAADGLEPRGLGRQPAVSDRLGRRSAKRLGRTRRVDSRRIVVGHERQPVSQLATSAASTDRRSHRPSCTCAGCRRRCSARTCACTALGEREPWAFGTEAEAICRKWLAFRYRLIPYLESVIARRDRRRACR